MYAKTPCPKCNWKFEGFHVCIIDLRTPEGRRHAMREIKPRKKADYSPRGKTLSPRSEEHSTNHAIAMREYWAKKLAAEKPVHDAIIAEYADGGASYKSLASKYPYNREKIARILREAAAAGRITLRQQGRKVGNE